MEFTYIVISLAIIFGACPFIGRKLYSFAPRQVYMVYFICSAAFFGLNVLFSTPPDLANLFGIINNIIFNYSKGGLLLFLYFLTLFTYMISGIGIFGGMAEGASEIIEESGIYSSLQKKMGMRSTFMSIFYGYIFIFGLFAINRAIMIILDLNYKPEFLSIKYVFDALFFESPLIVLLGLSFIEKIFCADNIRMGYVLNYLSHWINIIWNS